MRELYEILSERFNLYELLTGDLYIDDVLSDINVIDFLAFNNYDLIDIEEYILKIIK